MTLLKVFDYIVNNLSYHDMSNFDYNFEIYIHEYDMLRKMEFRNADTWNV